jgi:outer membrane protein assembly factor BamA
MRVAAVQFGDPLAQQNKRVRERLDDIVGKAYSRFAVELFLREQVRPIYFERGHLRVHFGKPEARFTGDPNKPLPDQVTLVVPIEPGPAYNWAGAEWHGIAAFGAEPLNAALGLTIGELANGNKIHAALERVRGEYISRGYLDVDIQAEPGFSESEAGGIHLYKALYGITVTEGLVYRMGELIVTGLSVTGERKLVEAWKIPAGEYFNQLLFDDFVKRLESDRPSIFGDLPIHYDEVGRWLRKNAETRTVDVLFDFK